MKILRFACLILLAGVCFAADPAAAERLRRFNDAKFGMFIHWGPYSLASVEASWPIMVPGKWGISEADYRKLPERFNPVKYDPKAWVALAKETGQRYMVFTTKHHDGFCMFDSAYTNYKITNTLYKKDVVAALAAAAKEGGMPLGFYYSPPDMNHPAFRDTSKLAKTNWAGEPAREQWPIYLDYMQMQLRELLTRYGDVFLIWFDGLGHQEKYDGYRFHRMIHEMQPLTIINNRIGLTGDYVTPEQRVPKGIPRKSSVVEHVDPNDKGVLTTPPTPEDFQPWETCMTINNTWGYNANDHNYKSATVLIRTLVDTVSKGGNFLLNVGPTPEGEIQPEFQERLRAIGRWMKVNGEAIYGTTYGPLQDLKYGRTTAKGKTVYVHVFDWPAGKLEVPGLRAKATKVTLLAGRQSLKYSQQGSVLSIDVPAQAPDADASVIAIETR